MSARDELAETVGACMGPWDVPGNLDEWEMIADAILAAGYSKPRTITTAEELDALPNGSVVLSDVYRAHHGQAISFQRWEDGCWHRGARSSDTHPDNFLPAIVLYSPKESK
jgi:hypothetical protein